MAKGKWVNVVAGYKDHIPRVVRCSKCSSQVTDIPRDDKGNIEFRFCPYCGFPMSEKEMLIDSFDDMVKKE